MNEDMTIGEAVEVLKQGGCVARKGWNGKGMWLALKRPSPEITLPYVFMKTADGNTVPWLCSQTDLLATDWVVSDWKIL